MENFAVFKKNYTLQHSCHITPSILELYIYVIIMSSIGRRPSCLSRLSRAQRYDDVQVLDEVGSTAGARKDNKKYKVRKCKFQLIFNSSNASLGTRVHDENVAFEGLVSEFGSEMLPRDLGGKSAALGAGDVNDKLFELEAYFLAVKDSSGKSKK